MKQGQIQTMYPDETFDELKNTVYNTLLNTSRTRDFKLTPEGMKRLFHRFTTYTPETIKEQFYKNLIMVLHDELPSGVVSEIHHLHPRDNERTIL